MPGGKGQLNLEQLATQDAGQAEDARTEQQNAAGLRSRAGGGGDCRGAARAPQRERFRRDRSDGVFLGLRTNLSSYPSRPDRRSVR